VDRQEQAGGQGEELAFMQIVDEVESDLISVIKNDWPNLPSGKSVRELLPDWMAYKARSIVNIPRKVIVSHRVQALRTQVQEISTIENLFTSGGDLKPYLSKAFTAKLRNRMQTDCFWIGGYTTYIWGCRMAPLVLIALGQFFLCELTAEMLTSLM